MAIIELRWAISRSGLYSWHAGAPLFVGAENLRQSERDAGEIFPGEIGGTDGSGSKDDVYWYRRSAGNIF